MSLIDGIGFLLIVEHVEVFLDLAQRHAKCNQCSDVFGRHGFPFAFASASSIRNVAACWRSIMSLQFLQSLPALTSASHAATSSSCELQARATNAPFSGSTHPMRMPA